MQEELQLLQEAFSRELESSTTPEAIEQLRIRYLGRAQGLLTALMKRLQALPQQERAHAGKHINATKQYIIKHLEDKTAFLSRSTLLENIDITLPGIREERGRLHPLTQVLNELTHIFLSLGFEIYEGSLISHEKRDFDDLNFDPEHPARDSMDTFWLSPEFESTRGLDRISLRPHLTGFSVDYMRTHTPPFRFIYPGQVFRNEATDASHEHTFNQFEALIIQEDITFAQGKYLIQTMLNHFFRTEIKMRMRTGFFPFVEPGFEIDIQCQVCEGQGCSVCKHVGWLELMPGGMPHENVLRAGGLNPRKWQGFYINVGLDRLAMMRYGIEDIRHFRSSDLRFLKQF